MAKVVPMKGKVKSSPLASYLQLGSVKVESGATNVGRMAMLLWGPAGVGKTTFAATAPGKKLWLSFGDQEHVSVMARKDVSFAPLYTLDWKELFNQAQNENPFGLDKVLAENTEIGTIVVDSLTAISFKALQKAVGTGIGSSRTFTPTMEFPGQSAYGGRNGIVLETVTGLLRVTAKHNVHCIITAHEADPTTVQDDRGGSIVDYIGVMLGGQLVNNMSFRLSEIWYLGQESTGAKNRYIAVRPTRKRRPMKTRMFRNDQETEFVLEYNADKPDEAKGQMTIASFYDEWVDGGGKKLDIP